MHYWTIVHQQFPGIKSMSTLQMKQPDAHMYIQHWQRGNPSARHFHIRLQTCGKGKPNPG